MKKVILMAFVALMSLSAMAQQVDLRRKIAVSGNAELEITPDIIYIQISLKEYFRDNNNKKKVEINELETQLYDAVLQAGISKENLTISNVSSWNYNNAKRNKNPEFLASKQYTLKVSELYKYNQILDALDAKGIQNTYIQSYDHSNMAKLKQDLQIKALKDAKNKAGALLASIGNQLGAPIEIQEVNNSYYGTPVMRTMAASSMEKSADATMVSPEIDIKTIKLSYNMNVIFEIK